MSIRCAGWLIVAAAVSVPARAAPGPGSGLDAARRILRALRTKRLAGAEAAGGRCPAVAEPNAPAGSDRPATDAPLTEPRSAGPRKAGPRHVRTAPSLDAQLQTVVDVSGWRRRTTLGQAIDDLKNSTDPPLPLVVLWRDLYENAGIDRQTEIRIDGIAGASLETVLRLLLMGVSADPAQLDYVTEGGVIAVGTRDSLRGKLQTRVYDVSDLVFAAPPVYRRVPRWRIAR